MISDELKTIFVHIPKTAGCSIEQTLGIGGNPQTYTYLHSGIEHTYDVNWQHATPREIKLTCGDNKWNNYYKFCFVRNPWDRFVSYYFHVQKMKIGPDLSFKNFVLFFISKNNNMKSRHTNMAKPCTYWLDDSIEFIGKVEQIEKDFAVVCDKLNIQKELLHINRTEHSHYSRYYDKETIEIISNLYEKDIATFGYSFREE